MCNVDGLRGDLVINRTAKAFVAWEGRTEVTAEDVQRVIGMCLNHRMRKDVMDSIDNGSRVAIAYNRVFNGLAPPEPKKEEPKEEPKKSAGSWGGLPSRR